MNTNKKKIPRYPTDVNYVQYSNGLIPTGGVTGGGSQVVPAVITNYNNLLDPEKTSGVKLLSGTVDGGEGGNGSGTPGGVEGGSGTGTPGVGEGGNGSGSGTPGVGISGLSEGVIDPVVQGAYKQLYEHYDDIYKRNEEAATAQKNQAHATAEQNYQNAVAEAQAGYYKNLVGYGSKAEQLDRMGLGGSGYSDYLTGKAMELRRSETQAAAVERNAAKSAADQLYSQNLLTAESARDKDKLAVLEKQLAEYKQNKIDRNTVIAGLLDFASSGNADIDTLKALGKEGGIAADDPIWITVEAEIERAAAANNEANLQSFKQWLFAGDKPFIDNYNTANPADVNKFYARASLFGVDTNSDEFGALAQQLGIPWEKKDPPPTDGTTITDEQRTAIYNVLKISAYEGKSFEEIQKEAEDSGITLTEEEKAEIQNIVNGKLPKEPEDTSAIEKSLKTVYDKDALWDIYEGKNLRSIESRVLTAQSHNWLDPGEVNQDGYKYSFDSDSGNQIIINDNAMNDGDDFDIKIGDDSYQLELGLGIRVMWEDDYGVNSAPSESEEGMKGFIALRDTLNGIIKNTSNRDPEQGDSAVVLGDLYVFAGGEWRTTSARYGASKGTYKTAVEAYINACKVDGGASA
jgi:hypothetical protein